jgi:hypothetical protein
LASPKRDWVVGDVRGIQEVTIDASMASNIFAFKYLLGYFAFMAVLADRFGRGHEQQARRRHDVLATLASKISRYLAPQVYSSIFSGRKNVTIAEPGQIVLSYETYMLVRDMVSAHALPRITVKGIHREIVPQAVDAMLDATGAKIEKFSDHTTGLDFYLDPTAVDAAAAGRIRGLLQDAIDALDRRSRPPTSA